MKKINWISFALAVGLLSLCSNSFSQVRSASTSVQALPSPGLTTGAFSDPKNLSMACHVIKLQVEQMATLLVDPNGFDNDAAFKASCETTAMLATEFNRMECSSINAETLQPINCETLKMNLCTAQAARIRPLASNLEKIVRGCNVHGGVWAYYLFETACPPLQDSYGRYKKLNCSISLPPPQPEYFLPCSLTDYNGLNCPNVVKVIEEYIP